MTRSSGQGGRYSLAELVARAAFPLMALASAGAFWLATPRAQDDYIRWLLFLTVYLILACLPTWLYTRFLSVKLTSIYVEYVLNLHRLGVDRPEFLPEPPYTSEYHETWANATKRHHTRHPRDAESAEPIPGMTVYDAKFDAYYGDRRDDKQGVTRFCGLGSLLPVVVCWLAFATGWLTIFTEPGFISGDLGSVDLADALRFAFLGVYVFSVQLTVRAFFQNDLRSGTYVAIMERLGVALILVSVAHVVWAALPSLAGMEPVIAFVIGTFPLVGQEWLVQIASDRMGKRVQVLQTRHPLSEIDGMNVWYEARLLEEGVENVQNLSTANIVDVVLHSRAPVGRIVDWIDQALLINHLPPRGRGPKAGSGRRAGAPARASETDDEELFRRTLTCLGVRTATDLLDLYAPLNRHSVKELEHDLHPLWPAGSRERDFRDGMLEWVPADRRTSVRRRLEATLRCLASEPNLRIVLNWQTGHGPLPRFQDAVPTAPAPAAAPSLLTSVATHGATSLGLAERK